MSDTSNSQRPMTMGAARFALEGVRNLVEAQGWDAPFTVYGIRVLPGKHEDASVETPFGGRPEVVEVVLLGEGSHPFEDLPGRRLPERFAAAILATEGWQYPRRLDGAHRASLELEGTPASLPDRLENRLLTYLSRSGDSLALLLTYENRETAPEEVAVTDEIGGRVQDAFRRFVGLPVQAQGTAAHVFGRFWLVGLLTLLRTEPDLRVDDARARSVDPLEPFVEALRESGLTDDGHGGRAGRRDLRELALDSIAQFGWEDLHRTALLGVLDFGLPAVVLEWCDAGMFSVLVSDAVATQRELLDALFERSPRLASEAFEELDRRGWLEAVADAWPRLRRDG